MKCITRRVNVFVYLRKTSCSATRLFRGMCWRENNHYSFRTLGSAEFKNDHCDGVNRNSFGSDISFHDALREMESSHRPWYIVNAVKCKAEVRDLRSIMVCCTANFQWSGQG